MCIHDNAIAFNKKARSYPFEINKADFSLSHINKQRRSSRNVHAIANLLGEFFLFCIHQVMCTGTENYVYVATS
ncbi:hypothetical protein A1OK_22015 [Enterovibrio norvegicus FF-454]|uniref:Uncharacterized protein n=1 Tax=Enterovibrio norvegicus FF-454 TaxID=1185651 RepID=A0A1E5C6J3_9GAMM|nr:hypothetical protein A1OK_22015 [Enterovibrio norvegicus FF-454]